MKDFLDKKRDKSQVVPVSLQDFRAMLDNSVMNLYTSHMLGQIGSDDYFVYDQQWQLLTEPAQKNGYIWADEIFEGKPNEDWGRAYEKILYANMVLEGLDDVSINNGNKDEYNSIQGSALFFRGSSFFQLAQLFCKQYNPVTASDDLGLPLKLSSNINEKLQRASLASTYDRIFSDLKESVRLLPFATEANTRPSKAAAYAMLAKANLQIGDFANASLYADSALNLRFDIVDYNSLDTSASYPFPQYGKGYNEIILLGIMNYASIFSNTRMNIDSTLFDSYYNDDLRKKIFFYDNNGINAFKGSLDGSVTHFSGLTTTETLLIRAECNARLGNYELARQDMDQLLSKRYKTGTYINLKSDLIEEELIAYILLERRKELVFRGVRWHDLKRLKDDPEYATSIKRVIANEIYELSQKDDPKWVWPIPPDVIRLGGIEPNPR